MTIQSRPTASTGTSSTHLPIIHSLKIYFLFSILAALFMGTASIAGLLYPDTIYPAIELRESFLANDVVNILIGLPILLGSMWLAWRGKLIGLLFWPGALFYTLYNYMAYLFAVSLTMLYPIYLAIVVITIYAILGLVANIDGEAIKFRLNGRIPEKFTAAVLTLFGTLFLLLAVSTLISALINQTPITRPELALLVVDTITSPAWIIGGILLWRRQALGYVGGAGLLFQASMLFIGLIAVLILQPFMTDAPFSLIDVVVVTIMGSICFIPFGFFIRGIVKAQLDS